MPTDETPAERLARLRKILADLKREERDAKLRQGRAKPRTHREMEIFGADLIERRDGERPDKGRATP